MRDDWLDGENERERGRQTRSRRRYREKRAKRRIVRQAAADWFDGHEAVHLAYRAEWDPERGEFVFIPKPYLQRDKHSSMRKLLKTQTNRRYRRGRRYWFLGGKSGKYKRAFDDWNVY